MSDAQADPERVLTYGGWRVSRPGGLGRFTMGQTLWLFAASAVLVVVEFTKGLACLVRLCQPASSFSPGHFFAASGAPADRSSFRKPSTGSARRVSGISAGIRGQPVLDSPAGA